MGVTEDGVPRAQVQWAGGIAFLPVEVAEGPTGAPVLAVEFPPNVVASAGGWVTVTVTLDLGREG